MLTGMLITPIILRSYFSLSLFSSCTIFKLPLKNLHNLGITCLIQNPNRHSFSLQSNYRWAETLFDEISDTVYFIKDTSGKYLSINRTLVERCGLTSKDEIIGHTVDTIMPSPIGTQFFEQDEIVLKSQNAIKSKLELHLYTDGRQDWCLTWKKPLFDENNNIAGLCGISRDLQSKRKSGNNYTNISAVLAHIQENISTQIRIADLTKISELSDYQLDKRMKSLFGISLGQYITRERINLACNELAQTSVPISQLALKCGYNDQAAFSRQFKQSVGLTPIEYRKTTSKLEH